MESGSALSICPVTPRAVLRISGEDALAFLQGQFTQELRHPPGPLCAYGLWLTQKGKVLADSYALRRAADWLLVSELSDANVIRERLEAYIIADDVVVEDVTAAWEGALLVGDVSVWSAGAGFQLPTPEFFSEGPAGLLFRGRRGGPESWIWMHEPGKAPQGVIEGAQEVDESWLEHRRIERGVPLVPRDVGPGDLPNEGALETVAISYTKGCYLGQEVIARLKSMGQVRRRVLRVRGATRPAAVPAELFAGTRKVGELRSLVPEGSGFVGLAMLSLLNLNRAEPLAFSPEGEATVHLHDE